MTPKAVPPGHDIEGLHHPGHKPGSGFWVCVRCGSLRECMFREADLSQYDRDKHVYGAPVVYAYRWRKPGGRWSVWRKCENDNLACVEIGPAEKMPPCAEAKP
jgi:hypothetical protein